MEKVNITYAGAGVSSQQLSQKDKNLVVSNYINSAFGAQNDYLELYIYNETGGLLESDYDAFDYYPSLTANPKNNTYSNLTLDPEKDLKNRGYNRGNLNIQYNFYKRLFNSAFGTYYWIKEISTSRTEIKLASQVLSISVIAQGFEEYQNYISANNYYPIFYLNFGNNQTVIATNVAFTEDELGGYLIVKLYEPLPLDYDLKTQLWIVDKVAESVSFDVSIQTEAVQTTTLNALRGPNFDVKINTKNGQTTPYYNYQNLLESPISSSYQKLVSYYQDRGIQINVDYSNFSNFIHFSSAVARVNNFVEKVRLIENSYSSIASQSAIVSGSSTVIQSSISAEQKVIDDTIKNFDIYEYFLYFQSSSWAWPKSNSTQPYTLYSVTSSQVSNFLGSVNTVPSANTASLLFSASYYDATNKDLLHNSIPQYLLDDPSNQPYVTFIDMIGQHFDNIWVYYKDITNRYNATNNPDTGISLDLVSDALEALGHQLYTNTNVSDNLYYTLFGINPDGSLLPPTGSEIITNYVTSSLSTLPAETIQDELYKRVYHNLPYLLKSKGTSRGVKALINLYGIPDSILTVREFGGNPSDELKGILDLNAYDYKVRIVTGSGVETYYIQTEASLNLDAENTDNLISEGTIIGLSKYSYMISSSLLSPYTTVQYYLGNTRLNNTNVEVGFSPADIINANIVADPSSSNVEQLIASPGYAYSSSYVALVSASDAYFSTYTQPNSIWEYMRLLKFYNNTLFKTVKDFVPARSNVSTGIIVKSHMFERNKYARHEPSLTFNDYSQSIDMVEISADNGGAISGSTAWSGFVVTPLGLASYSSSQNQELYNGQFDGSEIVATDGLAMQQGDYISHITGAVDTYNYGALYQNVTSSVKAQTLIDLDYNSDQLKPVNYGAVTFSLDLMNTNAYSAYTNPNNPFAQVQEYNYNLLRSITPRYIGSETVSATYNTYTAGDQSYGKTAAIDKIKYQYAYIVNIYSSSFQLPLRAKGQIKYIIDTAENVLNLSKTNANIFTVQNVFKSGEYADVSLFDYSPSNPYVQRLNNQNNDFTVWESGYSYTPVLYNIGGSGSLTFNLIVPSSSIFTSTVPSYMTLSSSQSNYWTINSPITAFQAPVAPYTSGRFGITGSSVVGGTNSLPVIISFTITNSLRGGTFIGQFTIPSGNSSYRIDFTTSPYSTPYNTWLVSDGLVITTTQQSYDSTGGSVTSSLYTTTVTDNAPCLLINDDESLLLSYSQSLYYGNILLNTSHSSMDTVVFPLELASMDLIKLYNSSSGFSIESEYRIKDVIYPYISGSNSESFVRITVDKPINTSDVSGSVIPGKACKYIILKRLQDETSVYFNYNLPQTISQEGTLFPQYIGEGVKEASGNVIKSLKQQNLI